MVERVYLGNGAVKGFGEGLPSSIRNHDEEIDRIRDLPNGFLEVSDHELLGLQEDREWRLAILKSLQDIKEAVSKCRIK